MSAAAWIGSAHVHEGRRGKEHESVDRLARPILVGEKLRLQPNVLEELLRQAVSQNLAAKAATTPLLRKFSDVRIGEMEFFGRVADVKFDAVEIASRGGFEISAEGAFARGNSNLAYFLVSRFRGKERA